MSLLFTLTRLVDRFLAAIARAAGWLFIATVAVICFDVITRKFGFQLPSMGSTRLQELEWHLAAGLFLGWIGYGVVRNSHVRIDVFTAHMPQRCKDWIDFWGSLLFALPYCLVVLPYAWGFFHTSFIQLESSDAPNGLPARFVIKGLLFLGLVLLLAAVLSLICRKIVDLFGPARLHSSNALVLTEL